MDPSKSVLVYANIEYVLGLARFRAKIIINMKISKKTRQAHKQFDKNKSNMIYKIFIATNKHIDQKARETYVSKTKQKMKVFSLINI